MRRQLLPTSRSIFETSLVSGCRLTSRSCSALATTRQCAPMSNWHVHRCEHGLGPLHSTHTEYRDKEVHRRPADGQGHRRGNAHPGNEGHNVPACEASLDWASQPSLSGGAARQAPTGRGNALEFYAVNAANNRQETGCHRIPGQRPRYNA